MCIEIEHTLLLSVIAVLASCATPKQAEQDLPPPQNMDQAIHRSVQPLVQRSDPQLPGLIVGVWRNEEVTWKAYGEQEMTPGSLVRVASMTKPMVGLLLATYVVEGVVDYDSPVGVGTCDDRKVSAFCFRGAPTTFRHLVQHTSGLPVEPDNLDLEYRPGDLQDFLARYELSIQPGARFRYSTVGYAALGMALTRQTRQPFAEAMQQRVIDPLGLAHTTFTPDPDALVTGYVDGEIVADPARPPALWPSGGQASTPEELLQFAVANLRPDSVPKLNEAIRLTHRVSSDVVAFDGSNTAFGWFFFEPLGIYWHAGSAPGYSVFTAFAPNFSTAVVLVTNTSLPKDGGLAQAAFELIGHAAQLP